MGRSFQTIVNCHRVRKLGDIPCKGWLAQRLYVVGVVCYGEFTLQAMSGDILRCFNSLQGHPVGGPEMLLNSTGQCTGQLPHNKETPSPKC